MCRSPALWQVSFVARNLFRELALLGQNGINSVLRTMPRRPAVRARTSARAIRGTAAGRPRRASRHRCSTLKSAITSRHIPSQGRSSCPELPSGPMGERPRNRDSAEDDPFSSGPRCATVDFGAGYDPGGEVPAAPPPSGGAAEGSAPRPVTPQGSRIGTPPPGANAGGGAVELATAGITGLAVTMGAVAGAAETAAGLETIFGKGSLPVLTLKWVGRSPWASRGTSHSIGSPGCNVFSIAGLI